MVDNIDFVKREILGFFKERNANVGHVLHAPAFNFQRMMNWNPKQKDALNPAISQLIEEGLVEDREGNLALTQKGVDFIY